MNLTVTVEDDLLDRARQAARAQGKTLDQIVEELLRALAEGDDPERDLEELRRLTRQGQGRSRGWKFDREASHERR